MTTRPHGTRSRYVTGCRCDKCRKANTDRYRERQQRAIFLASLLTPAETFGLAPQTWTAPDGSKKIRNYQRACPGVDGKPCTTRSHLRKDSKHGICAGCRESLVWNGIVDASPARAHIQKLSRKGIGLRAIAAISDVSRSLLQEIRNGKAGRIRAQVGRRILAVTPEIARGAGSLVPATKTWTQINRLLAEGFTKRALARRLGSSAKTPAIQFRRDLITAASAMRVEKFYNLIMAI